MAGLDLHNIENIEIDNPQKNMRTFSRHIKIVTKNNRRFEITLFSKNKENLKLKIKGEK